MSDRVRIVFAFVALVISLVCITVSVQRSSWDERPPVTAGPTIESHVP